MKKENKFFGYFTNERFQRALRNPTRANIMEAVISAALIFGIELGAAASWSGICWIWKHVILKAYYKLENKYLEMERKKLAKKGGKK